MQIGDIPWENLSIGDKVISCIGKPGHIAALYPVGSKDPFERNYDDWNGGILFLWYGLTWSIAGYSGLEIEYFGET